MGKVYLYSTLIIKEFSMKKIKTLDEFINSQTLFWILPGQLTGFEDPA